MEQTGKTHKARDFSIGCFSWLIAGSLLGGLVLLISQKIFVLITPVDPVLGIPFDPDLSATVDVIGLSILLFLLCILFFLARKRIAKRKWIVYGIFTAIIANILSANLLFPLLSGMNVSLEFFIKSLFTPFFIWYVVGGWY